jgi:hypothetical protein
MILLIAALLAADPTVTGTPAVTPPSQSVIVTAKRPSYHDPLDDDTQMENSVSDDTVVCHKNYATGSRLNVTKVCLTKRHWRELHNDQSGYLEQMEAVARH